MRKRRLSQVFLRSRGVVDRLVSYLPNPADSSTVLEIGAGAGAVTRALLNAGYSVSAVEIDPHWVSDLVRLHGRLSVTQGSILNFKPQDLAPSPVTIVGSLPYHISGSILRWLADHGDHIALAILILQDEVARRIHAGPGGRERGLLSVVIQSIYAVDSLFRIPPTAFESPPKVWSRAIRLRRHGFDTPVDAYEAVWRVARLLFEQRRKMIGGRIEKLFGREAYEYLDGTGLDLTRRPETLTLAEFELVTHAVLKSR